MRSSRAAGGCSARPAGGGQNDRQDRTTRSCWPGPPPTRPASDGWLATEPDDFMSAIDESPEEHRSELVV
jgi:hypothetical protein